MSAHRTNVRVIAAVAAMGGLLLGFDTGVISGAQNFLQDPRGWGVSDGALEWITTSVLIGAIIGAAFSGKITDLAGRRRVVLITAVLFTLGALFTGAAPSVALLVAGRIIIGLAIGVASYTVPLYISEISPVRIRGWLVTLNQLMITIGILVSYISDYLIADDANPFSWRWMFYVGVIPAILLFAGMLFVPETPRWLIGKGRLQEGKKVLARVEDPELVEESFRNIRKEVEREERTGESYGGNGLEGHRKRPESRMKSRLKLAGNYRELLQPWLRAPLMIAVGLMFFQQMTGINTIIYYSPKIFKLAGIESNTLAILPSIVIGSLSVICTLISMSIIDRIGRRTLYFIGMSGMTLSLAGMGFSFFMEEQLGDSLKYFAMASTFLYIIFFAVSLGPLAWLIISEVFPLKVRGVGMSIGSLSVWLFNAIVTFTFLKLVNALTPAGAFWVYGAIGILALFWGNRYLPETRGISLESLEQHWKEKSHLR